MAHASRLVAQASWFMAKKTWALVPPGPGLRGKFFLAMSHEPRATSLEANKSITFDALDGCGFCGCGLLASVVVAFVAVVFVAVAFVAVVFKVLLQWYISKP